MKNHRKILAKVPVTGRIYEITTNPALSPDFVPEVERLIEACGFLPTMLMAGEEESTLMKTALEENYPFGAYWNGSGVIDEQGIYRHPEDEPLHPIMSVTNKLTDDVAYIYQYGLVAARNEKGEYVTGRFD